MRQILSRLGAVQLGFGAETCGDLHQVLAEHVYRGSRCSFGYPARPAIEDQDEVQELLQWQRIGVKLSEEFQLTPEPSTSAIVLHHPEAKCFAAR